MIYGTIAFWMINRRRRLIGNVMHMSLHNTANPYRPSSTVRHRFGFVAPSIKTTLRVTLVLAIVLYVGMVVSIAATIDLAVTDTQGLLIVVALGWIPSAILALVAGTTIYTLPRIANRLSRAWSREQQLESHDEFAFSANGLPSFLIHVDNERQDGPLQ